MFKKNLENLQTTLQKNNIDLAIITDDDSLYYFTGYFDFLHMSFGRPTILLVPKDSETILITPLIDAHLVKKNCPVDKIVTWNDGIDKEWREYLPKFIKKNLVIAIEKFKISTLVLNYISSLCDEKLLSNISPILDSIRMVKTVEELKIARSAGKVEEAMMHAGKEAIGHNVPEYEVALATSQAGTRKAAEILKKEFEDSDMSPLIHFLQIMASGKDLPKTHHRASTKLLKDGYPVFLCFCGMTNFHKFKLGFDRTFWLKEIKDRSQIKTYETAVQSQKAALSVLGPGVKAEDVHAAYAEAIQSAGYPYPTFRCGRATGFSMLEEPQLVAGNKTILKPGMVFAVDGSANEENFRAQVGDSFIITENGYDQITNFSKNVEDLII
ncbi:MAG: aminopeptidase P family protein [Alphaproteobacteria bacterium]|nr:aminopeptidase P family protein [Alphaproteobacteria bacterium]